MRFNSKSYLGQAYTYTYWVDGVEYKITSTAMPEVSKVGDSCTIWYNPAKPKEAQPFHYDSNKTYKIILIAGLVLTPLGVILTLVSFAL